MRGGVTRRERLTPGANDVFDNGRTDVDGWVEKKDVEDESILGGVPFDWHSGGGENEMGGLVLVGVVSHLIVLMVGSEKEDQSWVDGSESRWRVNEEIATPSASEGEEV